MDKSEQEAINYFLKNGLKCKKIPHQETKTPDFEIYNNTKLIALCEVKMVRFDDWVGGCRNDPYI